MTKLKILNLYSGIGGNRFGWNNVDVTAIEYNQDIANVYQDLFPDDEVIVTDAKEYLLDNYNKYDFIWSSPPCQSHSRIRQFVGVNAKGYKPLYADLTLYQEIIFLQYNCKQKWIVENVNPYYKPLIEPTMRIGRHLFWTNFDIAPLQVESQNLRERNSISEVENLHKIDLSNYKLKDKRQVLRNCVDKEIGVHILKSAFPNFGS